MISLIPQLCWGEWNKQEDDSMKKFEKVNDIEKIYDTVNNERADDKLDCVAGGSGADNKYAAVKTGD